MDIDYVCLKSFYHSPIIQLSSYSKNALRIIYFKPRGSSTPQPPPNFFDQFERGRAHFHSEYLGKSGDLFATFSPPHA